MILIYILLGSALTIAAAIYFPVKFQTFIQFVINKMNKTPNKLSGHNSTKMSELCPDNSDDCILSVKSSCPDLDDDCLDNLSQMDYYLVGRENFNLKKD